MFFFCFFVFFLFFSFYFNLYVYILFFFSFILLSFGFYYVKSSGVFLGGDMLSTYECGYTEFNSTNNNFYTLQFFIVSLSFMLFDLEIILIIPSLSLFDSFFWSSLSLSVFLVLLIFGLLMEIFLNVFSY